MKSLAKTAKLAAQLLLRRPRGFPEGTVVRTGTRAQLVIGWHPSGTARQRPFMSKILSLLMFFFPVLSASGQTDVLTYRNDNMRTGQNTSETILTPSNVNLATFGKLFSLSTDGYVYAQPLYKSNVLIPGQGIHNVLFVATEHDSVYAFDADGLTSIPLWQVSFIDPSAGITTVPSDDVLSLDLVPEIGITGTPVIDPQSGTLYVVAKTKENGSYVQRLHALAIITGAEKFGGPVVIQASVPGTGDGGDGVNVPFNPLRQNQRAALLLANGVVYVAWASHGDSDPYHGWVLGYNATTLQQVAVFNATPNGSRGGIWQSANGPAADSSGNIFVITGNGTFDADIGGVDFGESFLKLSTNAGLTLVDFFTAFNQAFLSASDLDLGSSGPLLLPDQTGAAHPHLVLGAGKDGNGYLVDRDNMGHFNPTDNSQIVQIISISTNMIFGTPAFWQNNIYFVPREDFLKAFQLSGGLLSTAPTSQSSTTFGYGAPPAISANGSTNGIVWALDTLGYVPSGPAVLHTYDATNVATELWNSSQAANLRDQAGPAVKFTVPTIANGKIYVGTQNEITVYGLLGSFPPQVATPSFSPAGGTYSAAQSVTISDTTPGALIYYTTNGSTPTTSSTLYSGPIPVSSTTTIMAMATASGLLNSAVATATYTIQPSTGNSPSYGGGFTSAGLTLNGSAVINGTRLRLTDGGFSEAGSAFFNTPVNVQSFTNDFSFQLTNPDADGFTFTIQGNSPTALGTAGGGLGYAGMGKSVAVKFDLYNNNGEGINSTGLYVNGAAPTIPFVDLTNTGIDLHSGNPFNVHMTYDGTTLVMTITDGTDSTKTFSTSFTVNIPSIVGSPTAYVGFTGATGGLTAIQDILTWTYVSGASSSQAATPTFSPVPGTYSTTQSETLADATSGATIYYTTDGSTPTSASTVYSGPITVTTRIKAAGPRAPEWPEFTAVAGKGAFVHG